MATDRESTMRVEAIKSERDQMKQFRMYMDYIRDQFGRNGAADPLVINFEDLTDHDFEIYREMVSFFKSINEQNNDLEMIKKQCNEIIKKSKTASHKNFSGWVINEMTLLLYTDILGATWDGDGDDGKSVKKMVENCIHRTDPENLF